MSSAEMTSKNAMQELFEKFYENIKLTPLQREDARTKYEGVCKKLHGHYYPGSEYDGTTKLLIGSYGKHTNIRPPRDVDVLFIMPPEKLKQYTDNESNGASQLLQDVKEILSKKYSTTEKIKGWVKVVLVQFTDGTHNVELLPAWENNDGTFIIPDATDGGRWEVWDPRTKIKEIAESQKMTGVTKPLIRMIKKWAEKCTVELKSYQIEDEMINFLSNYDPLDSGYGVVARDFFKFFYERCAIEGVGSHLNTAYEHAKKACEFELQGDLEKAAGEWRKIFGDDFPTTLTKSAGQVDELKPILSDYSHAESPRWNFVNSDRVHIDAYVYDESKTKKFGGINSDGRNLMPGFALKYIAITNVPNPQYYWQIVNTGEKAKAANDLRGNILLDTQVRWEHTRYFGKHWIECFVIQDNVCVARSGKFFINIK